MHEFAQRDIEYVIRLDEVLWGGALLALTIVVHGFGMLLTLKATSGLRERFAQERSRYRVIGLGILIVAAWMIILVNLIEIMAWAGFYIWKGAQPTRSAPSTTPC